MGESEVNVVIRQGSRKGRKINYEDRDECRLKEVSARRGMQIECGQ
jgi:hypothetical protein